MSVTSAILYSQLFGASRLDAEFYQPKYVENELIILKFQSTAKLGEITTKFFKGIFDIKAEEYVADGVPFVRISNLKNGIIDESGLAFITSERHKIEKKTSLKKYDLILSKTAIPAASLVQIKECNASQDTIAVRTKWSEDFNAYLAIYLNTRFGLLQMERLFQGNIQMHLSLSDSRTITIPVPTKEFQSEIRNLFEDSIRKRQESKALYSEAEALLLRELGRDSLDLSPQIAHTANLSEAMKAHRLDAEYFQPKYYRVTDAICQPSHANICLGEIVEPIKNGFDYREFVEDGTPYIRVGDIKNGRINLDSAVSVPISGKDIGKNVSLRVGDILFTRKGTFGNAAVVRQGQDHGIISSEIMLLRLKDNLNTLIIPDYLALFLNSKLGYQQIERRVHGVAYYSITQLDLAEVKISVPPISTQEKIAEKVQKSLSAEREAKNILEKAKNQVEEMILGNE